MISGFLMRAWMHRGWFFYLAWPFALLFGVLLKLRAYLFRRGCLSQHRLPVPVIVVGNIFIGGTGKTPFTLWLLTQLKQAGFHPGVISRGYGRKNSAAIAVASPDSNATLVGDEPLLLAQKSHCPVVVGRDRVKAGQYLLSNFPNVDVIVADDGLQHLALARDIEIVVFDERGVGNGGLLPAGPLREFKSRPRDVTIHNVSVDLPGMPDTFYMRLNSPCARQLIHSANTQELSSLKPGASILAAAGIGHPDRFFKMLTKLGVQCKTMALPDHFDFAINPFKDVKAEIILITEKDAVKCRQSAELAHDPRIWVVEVDAQLQPGAWNAILEKLKTNKE